MQKKEEDSLQEHNNWDVRSLGISNKLEMKNYKSLEGMNLNGLTHVLSREKIQDTKTELQNSGYKQNVIRD